MPIWSKLKEFGASGGTLPGYLFGKGKSNVDTGKGLANSWLPKAILGTLRGLGKATYATGKTFAKAPVAYGEALYKYPKLMAPATVGLAAGGKFLYDKFNAYEEHVDPRYGTNRGISMRKEAGWFENLETAGKAIGHGTSLLGGAMMAGKFVNKMVDKSRQEQLIKNLANTDQIIKNADPVQVMSFYKTICNMAPKVSLDENAVKDLMHNFIKFGRIDMQSLKLLVETEKLYSEARKNNFGGFGGKK